VRGFLPPPVANEILFVVVGRILLGLVVARLILVSGLAMTSTTTATIVLVIVAGVTEHLGVLIPIIEDGLAVGTILVILVFIFILALILSTIGGVEFRVETIVTTDTLTPVVGVFGNHLILASASLGVVVISRDADHISRIDLEDHCLASVCIGEVREIVDGAEVQPCGASLILVIAHGISTHLTDLAHRVVKLARVNVPVIATDILEGEEVTILGERELAYLKEGVEFVDSTIARILHQVDHEVEQRLEGEILLHEGDHTIRKGVVDDLAVEGDCSIIDFDGLTPELVKVMLHFAREIDEIEEGCPVALFDRIESFGVVGMGRINREDLTFDASGNCSASSNCVCRVFH